MTEASPEKTLTQVFVHDALYQYHDTIYIAVSDEVLADLMDGETISPHPSQVTWFAGPGDDVWVSRMMRARTLLIRRAGVAEMGLREKVDHFERLREAILEVAEAKDWCEEYDAFAEEWGLTPRTKEWEVVMAVRVKARNEDDAVSIARDGVNLDSYNNDAVMADPRYEAYEA